jgi:hypothetical protein
LQRCIRIERAVLFGFADIERHLREKMRISAWEAKPLGKYL